MFDWINFEVLSNDERLTLFDITRAYSDTELVYKVLNVIELYMTHVRHRGDDWREYIQRVLDHVRTLDTTAIAASVPQKDIRDTIRAARLTSLCNFN
jgi:hypothetical protein